MTPMKRKTPYRTGMGRRANTGVIKTLAPVRMAMAKEVTRCSLTPKNCGFSPGMEVVLSFVSDCMWFMEGIVFAMNHGRPNTDEMMITKARTSRSRWYPQPFCNLK